MGLDADGSALWPDSSRLVHVVTKRVAHIVKKNTGRRGRVTDKILHFELGTVDVRWERLDEREERRQRREEVGLLLLEGVQSGRLSTH
jgi:hypothetical protein